MESVRPAALIFLLLLALDTAGAAGLSIVDTGAAPDGKTLDTKAIQAAINQVATQGGGTVIVPAGTFLSGALFLKPKVNLDLEANGVILGSTNIQDYPSMPTRVEGHTQVWRPALINASGCDNLQITGSGTIQGGGQPYYDAFYNARKANPKVTNLDVDRPRNLFIEDSKNVLISGVNLRDSGFWNIHIYRCQHVTIEKVDIRAPDRSPSTDGIDVDSCQDVTIHGCYIADNDDEIALKGTKGPLADQDTGSPPVSHIRISDCTFGHGGGIVTLGSEASYIHDVIAENCKIVGNQTNHVITIKLRPDTPQHYEDIHIRNIVMNAPGTVINLAPWTQFYDLGGHPAPAQTVENVSISNVTGSTTSFGRIDGPAKSIVRGITLENIDLQLKNPAVTIKNVQGLKVNNVKFNGRPFAAPGQPAS